MKLQVTDPDFIIKDENSIGQVSKYFDVVPTFNDIDKELFHNGFFSDCVGEYLYHKFYQNGLDESFACYDVMVTWLHEPHNTQVFDINKDILSNYYIVAGDETGIVYFERIEAIKVNINGHPIKIQEQANFYLIEILDEKKDNVYDGYKMTLKEAIEDMFDRYNIRKISPEGFTLGT